MFPQHLNSQPQVPFVNNPTASDLNALNLQNTNTNFFSGLTDVLNWHPPLMMPEHEQTNSGSFQGDLASLPGTYTFTDLAFLYPLADLGTSELNLATKILLSKITGHGIYADFLNLYQSEDLTLEQYRQLYGTSTPQFMKTFQIVFEKLKKGKNTDKKIEITTQQLIQLFLVFKDGDGRFLIPKEYENINMNYEQYMSPDNDNKNLPDAYAFLFYYDIEVMLHYNFEGALIKALQGKEYRQEYEMDDNLVKLLIALENKGTIPSVLDLVYDFYKANPDWKNPADWFKSNTRATFGYHSRTPQPYGPPRIPITNNLESFSKEMLSKMSTKFHEEIVQEPYIWFKRNTKDGRGWREREGHQIFLYKYENRKNSEKSKESETPETPETLKEKKEIIEDIMKVVAGVVTTGLLFSLGKYSYLQYKIKKCKTDTEMFEEKEEEMFEGKNRKLVKPP